MSSYDEQYKRNCKKIFLVVLIAIVLVFMFPYIKYFLNNNKNIIIVPPESYYFYSTADTPGDSYHVPDGDYENSWLDYDSNIRHCLIDSSHFNKQDRTIYVTGYTYNYPFKPEITVNGKEVKVKTERSNKKKLYHFEIPGPILPNQIYTIKITCENKSCTSKTVFHEDIEKSKITERIVYYTIKGSKYHYNKNCKVLQISERIIEGTKSFCGKNDPCDLCC